MTASLAGFVEFIRAQPVDRPLFHDSWYHCAVGEYAQEVEGMNSDDAADAIAVETGSKTPTLWGVEVPHTTSKTLMDVLDDMNNGLKTYGELRAKVIEFGY